MRSLRNGHGESEGSHGCVHILGPIEARAGGRQLKLGGPRQLTLLAVLVLHANRAVSRDTLIDAVWGAARPGADNRVAMGVSRLRKALEPLGSHDSRLRPVTGGYLLSLASDEVDADAFAAGMLAGQRALDEGAPARAVELIDAALMLWRGPPLAEVSFDDFAQAEIRRLEELRLGGLETRTDAYLQLGRHRQIIGELRAMLTQEPTRERIAAQLMLALYRSGRQAEALEIYQRTRLHLTGQLGLQPGPALESLQRQILHHSLSLHRTWQDDPLLAPHIALAYQPQHIPHREPDPQDSVVLGRRSSSWNSQTIPARLTQSHTYGRSDLLPV